MRIFQADNLSIHKNDLQHGFFSKEATISSCIAKIKKSYKTEDILKLKLELEKHGKVGAKSISILKQQHTNKVIEISQNDSVTDYQFCKNGENKSKIIAADGMLTKLQSLQLILYTADCAPVILFDPSSKIVAAIHIGWRGCLAQILEKAIRKIIVKGGKAENIIMAIGPMIQKNSYQVSEDFKDKFLTLNEDYGQFFESNNMGLFFNLAGLIVAKARKLGVLNIESLGIDTFEDKKNFFSHRRSNLNACETSVKPQKVERQISYAYIV